jgi:hypothetical protein
MMDKIFKGTVQQGLSRAKSSLIDRYSFKDEPLTGFFTITIVFASADRKNAFF